MRQVMHMFYASVFLMLSTASQPVNHDESLPTFRSFHQRIWGGEVSLADGFGGRIPPRSGEVDVISETSLASAFQRSRNSAARSSARVRRRITMTMP